MKKKILILGSKSFASTGLSSMLVENDFEIICFNRGVLAKRGFMVSGSVMELNKNPFLVDNFDVVINYILLKNESIEANLAYIDSLVEFCKLRKVEHLIHISSISVYPSDSYLINEKSAIEVKSEYKNDYALLKVEIDKYLRLFSSISFHVTFVRPGFIISNDKLPSTAGIFKPIIFNSGILMGNKKTTLPIIHRDCLNQSISNLIKLEKKEDVFIIASNNKETKYNFIKSHFDYLIIPMPKDLILIVAKVFYLFRIFNFKQYLQIKGLFRTTVFDSSFSEKTLGVKFSNFL